jgi:protein-tyrosine phosphatase
VIDKGSGSLAIAPHPSSASSLHFDVEYWASSGIDTVVSLLTDTEEQELDLSNERTVVAENGMNFRSFAVPDMCVPQDLPAFCELATEIVHLIGRKRRIIVHCWAGIGRSGLLASAVLVLMGHDPETVFDLVTMVRGESVPDTQDQVDWFVEKVVPHLTRMNC